MLSKPLISVIVPVYNAENYISNCIKSIMNQSYKHIEIIVVDDGSTDKSAAICDNYALFDKRIKVIHQENGGISSARNAGLDIMTGEYITFIDSDDFIHPQFIKAMLYLCMKYQCEISACKLYLGSDSNFSKVSVSGKTKIYNKIDAFLSRKIKSGIVGKVYKASLFQTIRFPVSDHFNYEDEAIIYRLVNESSNIAITEKPLYYYYQSPNSTTRNKQHFKNIDFIEVFEDRLRYFIDKDKDLLELSKEYYCLCLMLFYMSCKKDKFNLNNTDEILRLYKKIYKQVMSNKITPIPYKIMFTMFYVLPDTCSVITTKLRLRV